MLELTVRACGDPMVLAAAGAALRAPGYAAAAKRPPGHVGVLPSPIALEDESHHTILKEQRIKVNEDDQP
jgi:hypothetical protein